MKASKWMFLFVLMFLSSAQVVQAGSVHKDRFCKMEKHVNHSALMYSVTAIDYSFKISHAVLAVLWQIDKDTEYLRRVFRNDWPNAKTALQYAGKFSYFKVAARTFIPFMDKTGYAVNAGKVNFSNLKGGNTVIRADSSFDRFYKSFVNAKYYWGYFSTPYMALSYSTMGVCKQIKLFTLKICVRKKKNCGDGFEDGDAVLVGSDGQEIASANRSQCSQSDDQKVSRYVALSNRYKGDAAAINAIVSAVAPSLKAAAGPAKALTNAVRPMMGTLKGIQKTLSILKKGMLPIKYLGKKIQSLMNQQICVGYIVPGKKKVCTKKKILGKKRKICTWRPTKETKKFCSKVGKVIGRVNKLAKVIQKPMDTAIKKLTDPIVKPILKRLPGFTASKLLSQVKKISGSLGVLAKMGALSKKYSPGKLKAYTLRYKALERELLKLNR